MFSFFTTQKLMKLLFHIKASQTVSWDFALIPVIPYASVAFAGGFLLHPHLYGYFNFI